MSDTDAADSATVAQIAERLDDLARVVARQTQTLDRLVDADRARARQAATGADLPLLVDLFALYTDALTCADGTDGVDRDAFAALAAGLDRLIRGRGGALVTPSPDAPFDTRTMEAVDVVDTDDPAQDRTVAVLIRPGLQVADRSVRAAAVIVRRHRGLTQSDRSR